VSVKCQEISGPDASEISNLYSRQFTCPQAITKY
jgi:hypothetical protein